MRNPFGLALVLIGVVRVALGFAASESFGSSFSKFFTGEPTDRAIWLFLGGIACIGVGGGLTWRGSRN